MPEPEELLFPQAVAHNTGVVIMNATRSDKLLEGPDAPATADFYRYVLGHPAVSVVLRGLRGVERFEEVARGLAERETLSPEQRRQLEAYGAAMRAAGKLD
jgi:predicted aldo/keto reductase-like oxidoreductase